tara:strand:- start:3567 stop:4373 length:807 start_codon:yes stop_codon:yes gene_type:complete
MAIYDCFQFFNEDHIADLRFNILDRYVDKFIVVESTVNHQGTLKNLNFDLKKYSKFKNKIHYIVVDDTPENIKRPHKGGESLVEQHQRNSIMRGLNKADDNDLIILSDVDEIPNLEKINEYDKNKYAVFSQRMYMYKLNLLNLEESNWHGSRMCLKKDFKSPQWIRDLKFKKYPFWRIDKIRNLQIIKDGGWHFSFLQSPQNISKKIKSFAHGEFNKNELTDEKKIVDKVNNFKDIFGRGHNLVKVNLDETYPDYIIKNKTLLKNWII